MSKVQGSREVSRRLARRFSDLTRRLYSGQSSPASDLDEDVVRLPARPASPARRSFLPPPRDDRDSGEDD